MATAVGLRQGLKLISDSSFPFAWATTQQDEFPLPDQPVKRIWGRLKGTFLPGAVVVPGTPVLDGAVALVPKIVLQLDGKEWKQGSLGSFLRLGELYDQADADVLDIYSGAAISQDFDILIPFLAESAGSVEPTDSLIDGRVRRKLQVEVNWGTAASLLIGNTSTPAVTNCVLELYYEATAPFDVTAPFWLFRESDLPFQNIVTALQADFKLPYEQGNVIRFLQIRMQDAGDLVDTLIDKLSLLINGTKEIPLLDLKKGFIEGYTKYNFGVFSLQKGYIHIELCERDNGGSHVLKSGLGANGTGDQINALALRCATNSGVGPNTSIVVHVGEMVPAENQ